MSLALLIIKIIILIVAGTNATIAVDKVAQESGTSFAKLWQQLPERYK